jgi:hypothetical protein
MGAFGGVAGQTAEKVKPAVAAPSAKKPAGLMSTKSGKLLRGAALLGGVGFAGVGAKMLWDKMHKDPGAELSPPTVVTPQTQNLALTTKKVESAKDQRMAAPAPTITNITNSPSTVTNSQGIIGGPTVADRGSLNLSTF